MVNLLKSSLLSKEILWWKIPSNIFIAASGSQAGIFSSLGNSFCQQNELGGIANTNKTQRKNSNNAEHSTLLYSPWKPHKFSSLWMCQRKVNSVPQESDLSTIGPCKPPKCWTQRPFPNYKPMERLTYLENELTLSFTSTFQQNSLDHFHFTSNILEWLW